MALGFVVDNSIVMAWCFRDETSSYAQKVLESLADYEAITSAIRPLATLDIALRSAARKICVPLDKP